jgi:NAD(P)H dehydrogenase (quinone)
MWQFNIPALMIGFCERTFTPGFAYNAQGKNPLEAALLQHKSARLIMTMGMPAPLYDLMLGAHGGRAFKSMLSFCGMKPVRATYLGSIEADLKTREKHLETVRKLGKQAR